MSAPANPGPVSAPRRGRQPVTAFLASPINPESWKALGAILLGFVLSVTAFAIITSLLSFGASLILVVIGVIFIALAFEGARLYARVEIWRMSLVDPRPLIPRPHRPLLGLEGQPWEVRIRSWFETEFLDAARWYDLAYVAISLPLAVLEFTVAVVLWTIALGFTLGATFAIVLKSAGVAVPVSAGALNPWVALGIVLAIGIVLLPVAASSTRGMAILHRYVVEGLLCISPAEALRRENEQLRESRSAAVELEASELRRIERDLHDGAQQRLVMLAIDLSLAEDKVETDPAAARTLIAGARDQARQALAEIREVVRGTAPAILLDRGLVPALGAVAGRSPVPTFLDSDLPAGDRLPHAVERAAYYVVSEALTNIAKHAGASRVDVTLRRWPDRLGVWVRDDGRGGAAIVPGGGLAGLRDRVAALDGRLLLHSPAGGPTVVHVVLPLATTWAWSTWPGPPSASMAPTAPAAPVAEDAPTARVEPPLA